MAAVEDTFALSRRAAHNIEHNEHWRSLSKTLGPPYNRETNPEGLINLGIAESDLMHEELIAHVTNNFQIEPATQLTYGTGPNGSLHLRAALASFFNAYLRPLTPTQPDEFLVGTGLTSVVDALTWCLCDEGEGILIPQPFYTAFEVDIPMRSRGAVLPVSFDAEPSSKGTPLPYSLDAVFDPAANTAALERALAHYAIQGITARAVMLVNPHNPLGRCYPPATIKAIAAFCGQHNLHLLADEIYALSVFDPLPPSATPNHAAAPQTPTPFISTLALELSNLLTPDRLHILYSMSKDFCANGFRIGVLHSRSTALRAAFSTLAIFSWPSYVVQDAWAKILTDAAFLSKFMLTNQARLGTARTHLAGLLKLHGIPWYSNENNGGFFVWVYLGAYMFPYNAPGGEAGGRGPKITPHTKQLQDRLQSRCLNVGVFVRDGTRFYTERAGWFRISFTMRDEDAIALGIKRMVEACEALRGELVTEEVKGLEVK